MCRNHRFQSSVEAVLLDDDRLFGHAESHHRPLSVFCPGFFDRNGCEIIPCVVVLDICKRIHCKIAVVVVVSVYRFRRGVLGDVPSFRRCRRSTVHIAVQVRSRDAWSSFAVPLGRTTQYYALGPNKRGKVGGSTNNSWNEWVIVVDVVVG